MPRPQSALGATVSSRNRADIVFVIDRSGSMSGTIKAVKDNIDQFVQHVETNPQGTIDWRLGIVSADCTDLYRLNFVTDTSRFRSALDTIGASGNNETMLPALDVAASFPWQKNTHRVIIFFTDEPVCGGYDPEGQRKGIQALLKKLDYYKIEVYALTPQCEDYKALFAGLPRARHYVGAALEGYDFADTLNKIGQSVSKSASGGQARLDDVSTVGNAYDIDSFDLTIHDLA